jgi:predicted DNA-binding transcriptional regulator YafY
MLFGIKFSFRGQKKYYLRSMFASYLSLPIYEREKIIFKETYDLLANACDKEQPIRFTSTTDPDDSTYHAVPYRIEHSSEEMFNYLICQSHKTSDRNGKPYTFRLCRIRDLRMDPNPNSIKPEIKTLLDLMIENTPQYAIYEDTETCVLLTKKGMSTYNRIYVGRPMFVRMESLTDGRIKLYFKNSTTQLYFYFRRFEADEAVIQKPKTLANKIKAFHEQAWKAYETGTPIISKPSNTK